MKRCTQRRTDELYDWLTQHHNERVIALITNYPKDVAAKILRDEFHAEGITRGDAVYLSRAQIREALRRFRLPAQAGDVSG
jgi:hypothetical protein